MPLKISQHDIMRMKDQVEKMKKRTSAVTEKSHELVGTIVRTSEIGAAAFAMGLVQGKYGGVEIVGVPMDLGLGLGMHLAGLLGVGGNMSHHLHAFGDGSLAAYLTTLGRGTGLSWKHKSGSERLISTGEEAHAGAMGPPPALQDIPGRPGWKVDPKTGKEYHYKVQGERLDDAVLERLARGQ